ncbi:methylmalonyl-CoA mutase family protein [Prolixibacter sp. SD074]|uniref:methylmalonyl-CoA mutase family protein n=1 Tax=Prolixibacter sp. SD074 TaxID=2652391 RepID=UPI00128883F0|nr:methylmalonyl-CoA mutase family protein [Prolixibacter sp. SD074]GET30702.1 methylmalonyl-CoA mutase small subunit [Prolixibacter sp. SD074]
MAEKDINLFQDFPPVSTDEWVEKIKTDLKGKDYERTLVWRTNEGFNVQPFYRQENLEGKNYLDVLPGSYPYVRGNKKQNNDWSIRQDIQVTGLAAANAKALTILNKGVTSLGFVIAGGKAISDSDLDVLLKDICLEAAEINFVVSGNVAQLAEAFIGHTQKRGYDLKKVNASINYDPLSELALKGKMPASDTDTFTTVKNAVEAAAEMPNLQVISIDGKNYNNAGSSSVQELAFSLAMGAEYLSQLTDLGMNAGIAAPKIRFNLGIGGNYFIELAKLRAGRLLWAHIVSAYQPECHCDETCECGEECNDSICRCAGKMKIHSETSIWNKTVYDAYVNMLRTQTEAMSAALGGTDSMTVLPFNSFFEETSEFSERIARNQQILLKEESHLDKIVDPGAGSYYIELLTDSIAEEAWKLFLEVQEKGGFLAAFRAGFVQAKVNEMADKRRKAIAIRKESLLGVNQFPNFSEQAKIEFEKHFFEPVLQKVDNAETEPICLFRGAEEFEKLRYATDTFAKANKRTKAFMLTIGNLAMRKARAQFSSNFFAIAGYEVVDNNGFASVEAGVKAAKKANADIIVLCSSDDEYTEFGPQAHKLIENDAILVIAGAPACADELKAKGIENFVHVKTNLLEALKEYNKKLGIK